MLLKVFSIDCLKPLLDFVTLCPLAESNAQAFCDRKKGFLCETSRFCVTRSLLCNGNNNCGSGDKSDETSTCRTPDVTRGILHVVLGVVVGLIALVFVIVCLAHRHRKMRRLRNRKQIEVRYVTRAPVVSNDCSAHAARDRDGACSRGPNDDCGCYSPSRTLLTERTEKVSIV